MNQKEIDRIVKILKEEQSKIQDSADRSASDTYSKLHSEMKFELVDFKNQFLIHKNDFKHLSEKFEEHMTNEEKSFKKVMEILEKKAGKWVESVLIWLNVLIVGAVIAALIDLVLKK